MRAVYVMGGAGVGKSTFTAEVLDRIGEPISQPETVYVGPGGGKDAHRMRQVRGHRVGTAGLYLGVLREDFPGTDGMDKVIVPTATRWISEADLPWSWMIGEGLRLGNVGFLEALSRRSELIVLHLDCDPFITDLRLFDRRWTGRGAAHVQGSRTRAEGIIRQLNGIEIEIYQIDTADPNRWTWGVEAIANYLIKGGTT